MALKYCIDTNIFIYHFESHPRFGNKASQKLERIIKSKGKIVCSTLVIAELLAKKEISTNAQKRTDLKIKLLSTPNIELIAPDIFICEYAAILKGKYDIKLPDAIHIATALVNDCKVFCTADETLKKIKEIAVETL